MAARTEREGVTDGRLDGNANGNGAPARRLRAVLAILWPSFVAAAVAEFVIFAAVDPAGLHTPAGDAVSRPAAYTLGFLAFWTLGAMSSALTLYLAPRDGRDADPSQARP